MIDFRLYMITDRKRCAPRSLQAVVRAACDAGVRGVQLREKDLSPEQLEEHTGRLLEITRKRKAKLIVNRSASITANEDIFLAASTGADGFHFPDGISFPHELRERFPRLIVGMSTHSPAAAVTAATEGADFVTFGPVFETRSKKAAPQGLEALTRVCRAAHIPVFAVGGITPDNAADCIAAGAHGVAVIEALMGAPDVAAAVAAFRRSLGSL